MCAEEPLFSLTPVCHFLSLHPSSPQSAASCPSLLASDVPPAPSGTARDFTLSLRNVQEVRQTSSSAWTRSNTLVKMIGIEQKHMVCCFMLGYAQMDILVLQFGSINGQNWSSGGFKAVWDSSENQAGLCQSPLSFRCLARPMFFNDELSCVLVSTLLRK